jgi:hypothetical protein
MAAPPSGTYQTYTAIGNREDLIDLIVNISPVDTPVLSMTESNRAYNVLHEWQTDALKTPTAVARVEGEDANIKTVTPTSRLNNYTQIIDNNFIVSNTQLAVKSAGRADEDSYQAEKAMKELANDIEYAFVVNSAAVSGASATARQLKGLSGWITTNVSSATANRALTSTLLDALLKSIWLAGGRPDTILTGGSQKIAFTNTTNFPGMTRNISASIGEYKLFVDVYQGGVGGSLKLITSTIMGNNQDSRIYVLQMDKWRKSWLRPIKKVPLGITGDGQKFQIVAEVTLEALNEKASGVITQLS